MSVSGKYRGDKHSLNRLNYCEKNEKMKISSQAGYIQPNFAFQINTPSKILKKLVKNDKNSKCRYIVYLHFLCFQRFFQYIVQSKSLKTT